MNSIPEAAIFILVVFSAFGPRRRRGRAGPGARGPRRKTAAAVGVQLGAILPPRHPEALLGWLGDTRGGIPSCLGKSLIDTHSRKEALSGAWKLICKKLS